MTPTRPWPAVVRPVSFDISPKLTSNDDTLRSLGTVAAAAVVEVDACDVGVVVFFDELHAVPIKPSVVTKVTAPIVNLRMCTVPPLYGAHCGRLCIRLSI